GAEITATQTDTGAVRKTISNETGAYVLANLPVGPYRLEVSLPGFRTFVQSGIILQVNSSPVVNAVLAVGQVSETVEVQANAAMVETRSVGIGQVIENARILELPLIGRQVTDLVVLSGAAFNAGTAPVGNRQTYPNVSSFTIAGGLSAGNIFATSQDGLKRNQWGGTVGAPIKKNKLFFFAGFQGTDTRQTPSSSIAFVPTPAMLTGDFTAITSPACNSGRPIMLRAPFVNN